MHQCLQNSNYCDSLVTNDLFRYLIDHRKVLVLNQGWKIEKYIHLQIETMAESLVKQFQQLQEERVRTFRQLDDDHKVFLGHAPNYEQGFDDYKKAVNNCTERFKEISKEIIQIKETLLKDPNTNKVASLIGQVQDLEETKIHTVVDLQLAR